MSASTPRAAQQRTFWHFAVVPEADIHQSVEELGQRRQSSLARLANYRREWNCKKLVSQIIDQPDAARGRRPFVSLNLSETKAVVQHADMAGEIATGTRGTTATKNRWQRRRTSFRRGFDLVQIQTSFREQQGTEFRSFTALSSNQNKAVAGASAKTAKGPHRRLDAPIAANRKEKTNHEKEDSDE